jgi:formylglycine-generating enzyme required for sulfatase activity
MYSDRPSPVLAWALANAPAGLGLMLCVVLAGPLGAAQLNSEHKVFRDEFQDGTGRRGPEVVQLQAGDFVMGTYPSDPAYSLYTLPHHVNLSAFAIGRFSVTNSEFADFLNDRRLTQAESNDFIQVVRTPGLKVPPAGQPVAVLKDSAELPVTGVTWQGALAFSQWLSRKTGHTYTLPTEAQWEFAARAGSTTVWPWGDSFDQSRINCATDVLELGAQPREQLHANGFGLYGIPGNVWEWTVDCLDLTFYFHSPVHDPVYLDPQCPAPIVRGGSFRDPLYRCSPGFRVNYLARGSWDAISFRVVRRGPGLDQSKSKGSSFEIPSR